MPISITSIAAFGEAADQRRFEHPASGAAVAADGERAARLRSCASAAKVRPSA